MWCLMGISETGYKIMEGYPFSSDCTSCYDYVNNLHMLISALLQCSKCKTIQFHTLSRYGRGFRCDKCFYWEGWDSSGPMSKSDIEYDYRRDNLDEPEFHTLGVHFGFLGLNCPYCETGGRLRPDPKSDYEACVCMDCRE